MIPCEIADLLEQIAIKVERLPGVSRTKPHAFAEAKSELKGEILAEVRKLRNHSATSAYRRRDCAWYADDPGAA